MAEAIAINHATSGQLIASVGKLVKCSIQIKHLIHIWLNITPQKISIVLTDIPEQYVLLMYQILLDEAR